MNKINIAINEIESIIGRKLNQVQRNRWVELLKKIDEDVLIKGWEEFIDSITPGFIPSINKAKEIFNANKESYYEAPPEVKDKTYGAKVSRAIFKSLNKAWINDGGRPMYHKDQADFWAKEMNDKEMERKHNACNS